MAKGDETPVLKQILKSNFYGLPSGGLWGRHVKAEWLGPYTPELIQTWILKLMRKDSQLKLGLQALRSPFFGISYSCDENTGTPETRAFVKKAFLDTPLRDKFLKSALNSFDFGFQSHEVLWKLEDVTFDEDGPGGLPEQTITKANVFRGFYDVDPERLACKVDEYGDLTSILVDGFVEVPVSKLVHVVHDGEWQNHFGESMLKPAYNPWYWGNFLYLYLMRYAETRLIPPTIARAPFEYRQDPDKSRTDQDEVNALELIMEQAAALRNGSVAGLPSEIDPETKAQKFSLEFLRDEGRIEQFILAINHMQALKLRALCIPERAFTQDTETGSFAMVKEHVDAFLASLESYKDHTVIPALNRCAELITRANFKSAPAPMIKGSELARQKHQLMYELVSKALQVPLTLDSGDVYTPSMLIDFTKCMESFNTPIKKPSEVAVPREDFLKLQGRGQPTSTTPGAPSHGATSDPGART